MSRSPVNLRAASIRFPEVAGTIVATRSLGPNFPGILLLLVNVGH